MARARAAQELLDMEAEAEIARQKFEADVADGVFDMVDPDPLVEAMREVVMEMERDIDGSLQEV